MSKKPVKPVPVGSPAARSEDCWRFGTFEVAIASRELRQAGQAIAIEPKPLNLLLLLLRAPGELVTKEELIDTLWDGRLVSEGVIANCANKLRLALGEEGAALIKTVHGYGYRFVGQAERLLAPVGPLANSFEPGDAVPHRPNWRLQTALHGASETWVAEQLKTGERRVFKFARDARQLRALKREVTLYRLLRETLGPAAPVARLLDYQLNEPPCCIELEYCVDGSLLDWLRGPGAAASLEHRLALMAEAAEAVAAIHAQGILHKDLKPANFLLGRTEAGQPRLLLADFGSSQMEAPDRLDALAITRLGMTEMGVVGSEASGTQLYLAPELLAGQPRTLRSDVFSLGVMLYQLIVADPQRGLAPGWERDIEDPLLRADIAAAAERDPERRLGDAAALAQGLRTLPARHAARLEALRQEAENQRAREVLLRNRQHRPWRMAVAASLLLGMAGTGVMAWQAQQAQRNAETAASEAEHINDFLNDEVLAAADPFRAGGGREVKVGVLLDQAAQRLPALEAQPRFHARLSLTIANAYTNLGLDQEAVAILGHALKRQLVALGEGNTTIRQLRERLAWIAVNDARYPEARQQFERLRDTVGSLPEAARPEALRQARYGLARLTYEEGGFDASVPLYRALLAETAETEATREFRHDVEWDLAESLMETQGWSEAWQLLAGVEKYFAETGGSNGPKQMWLKISQGYWLLMHERWAEAESLFQKIHADASASLGAAHPLAVSSQQYLGILRVKQGQARAALPYFETVLTWRQKHLHPGHYLTNMTRMRIGEALTLDGRTSDAIPLLQQVLADSTRVLGQRHPHTLDILRTLAEAELAAGQPLQAEAHFREVLALAEGISPDNNRLNWTRYGLGRALAARGNHEASKPLLESALRDFSRSFGARHSLVWRIQQQMEAVVDKPPQGLS